MIKGNRLRKSMTRFYRMGLWTRVPSCTTEATLLNHPSRCSQLGAELHFSRLGSCSTRLYELNHFFPAGHRLRELGLLCLKKAEPRSFSATDRFKVVDLAGASQGLSSTFLCSPCRSFQAARKRFTARWLLFCLLLYHTLYRLSSSRLCCSISRCASSRASERIDCRAHPLDIYRAFPRFGTFECECRRCGRIKPPLPELTPAFPLTIRLGPFWAYLVGSRVLGKKYARISSAHPDPRDYKMVRNYIAW